MKKYVFLLLVSLIINLYTNAQSVNRNDVVIDEIMADPTPQAGLPDAEWIELKNISLYSINLSGWRIVKGAVQSGPFLNYTLQPDSFVIICSGSSATDMSVYGPTISVTSFPSLDNIKDLIYLKSNENKIISAVNYSNEWYKNELKKTGGWTLEMTDPKNACSGYSNWSAAVNIQGGTPGKTNSINALNPDITSPKLIRAFATDSVTLILVFNEPLDSLKSSGAVNFNISDGIGAPIEAMAISPLFDKIQLKSPVQLTVGKIYSIITNSVTDCAGNEIASYNTARAGLSSVADSLNIVINEILFNPASDGVDYVEIYNRSKNIIDLKQLHIANRNSTGVISSIQQLSTESFLIFPEEFIVITENIPAVQTKYLTTNISAFVQPANMPSFSDDKGNVIILNAQGKIVDEVSYSDKWHFELITDTEGISLERIDYNAPSAQANFHSAATSVGYGTPGYKNSQYRIDAQMAGEISLLPVIFSPDNDGTDDFATINYQFPATGYVASITIFDASGRPVRYLERNALCGVSGSFRWDGLGEKRQQLAQGIYIFFIEIFNSSGKRKQFKKTIVLARR
jgi:hypothetical protein